MLYASDSVDELLFYSPVALLLGIYLYLGQLPVTALACVKLHLVGVQLDCAVRAE